MKIDKLLKGSALLALARTKARQLDIDSRQMNLEDLIHVVQHKEGHQSCFRKNKTCGELSCCWQLSCKAEMIGK